MLKTKKHISLLVGLFFAGILGSIPTVLLTPNSAFADYTVQAGQKCENGSAPTTSMGPNGQLTYNCAESTRTGTPQQTTPGATQGTGEEEKADNTKDDVTCAIEKVGWLLCPILESAAKISDRMFDVLADNFLRTDTALFRDNSGTKTAWEVARNLANVMFIIAFLVIIISQVTGQGLNNYGIKRMLPRLIIAAIAVNVSYYICQLVVDLTNILGYEIQNALVEIANNIGPSVFGNAANFSTADLGNTATDVGVLTVIIVAALASTAAWLILGPGLAVITVVLITVLSIIVILMLRKALIVLLIVISPIAFVLYLLPNTEKFFNKWMKMFGQLLMVFPIVGLLFGAGQLASTIILVSGATTPPANFEECDPDAPATGANAPSGGIGNSVGTQLNTQSNSNSSSSSYDGKCDGFITISGTRENPGDAAKSLGAGKGASWTLGLVATGVAVAPLMAVYAVLKGALSAAGAIGGTINGLAQKGRGAGSKWGQSMDDRRKKRLEASALGNSTFGRGVNVATLGSARRKARRRAIDNNLDRELNMAQLDYTSQEAMRNEGFQRQLAGGSRFIPGSANADAMGRAESNAITQQRELQTKEVAAAHATVDMMDFGDNAQGGAAGQRGRELIAEGNFDSPHLAAILEHLGRTNQAAFMQLATDISSASNGRPSAATRAAAGVMSNSGVFSGGQVARMQNGEANMNLRNITQENMHTGGISPAALAKMNADQLRHLDTITAGDPTARANIISARDRMSGDQENNLSNDKLALLERFR